MTTPNPESSGPPLRAIAMVLIALAILFAGLGAASLGGSDSDDAATEAATSSAVAPTTAAARAAASSPSSPAPTTTTTAPTTTTTPSAPATSSTARSAAAAPAVQPDTSLPVRVFNNSNVSGLAAETADQLAARGWNVSETGNYSYGLITATTVYYGNTAAEKATAQAIAADLGVSAEPRFAGIASASPGVIVIVTSE